MDMEVLGPDQSVARRLVNLARAASSSTPLTAFRRRDQREVGRIMTASDHWVFGKADL
jgi:hypothetical protein